MVEENDSTIEELIDELDEELDGIEREEIKYIVDTVLQFIFSAAIEY